MGANAMTVQTPEPVVPVVPADPAPVVPATPAEPPADKTDWKAEARKHEARAKENKAAADELAALKAANATDAEKAAARAEAAEKRAASLVDRTVKAEVKALATAGFADPSDAALFLDLTKYVGADGDIDDAAITADLAAVLAAKPHLVKTTGPTVPKPNPAQGSGANGNPSTEADIAAAMKAGDFHKAITLRQQLAASLKH
jgi:hypothetical protein